MPQINPLTALLESHSFIVLDGALATELEARGCNLADNLWSAKVLMENPQLIRDVHLDYFRAGAQAAITASYQATPAGFAARGLTESQSRALIAHSVALAKEAREIYQAENASAGPLLVAGSVGPYGAYLADGSEYRGDYVHSAEEFQAFHRPRIEALLNAGADLLACETLPSFAEIEALADLLLDYPQAQAWFSFTLRDERHLSDGTPLVEVVETLAKYPQIVALGINCIALEKTTAALKHLHSLTALPLVVYPNSGETYDATTKEWHTHGDSCGSLVGYLPQWLEAGARLIGGCCRTTPKDIAALSVQRPAAEAVTG
ncbi:homocysteine S-methyltransferase [Pseudescherichia sp.]|uniref:homocysteine S-methyltransferase n=1 Tax=Pseudescherichia sp. TaxID=2055881 RepID=UPI0028A251A8|nr:homocysteine S-methyltransferase [Pseudescherichia sp.]